LWIRFESEDSDSPNRRPLHVSAFAADGSFEIEVPIDGCTPSDRLRFFGARVVDCAGNVTDVRNSTAAGELVMLEDERVVDRIAVAELDLSPIVTSTRPPVLRSLVGRSTPSGFELELAVGGIETCADPQLYTYFFADECVSYNPFDLSSLPRVPADDTFTVEIPIPECSRDGSWRSPVLLLRSRGTWSHDPALADPHALLPFEIDLGGEPREQRPPRISNVRLEKTSTREGTRIELQATVEDRTCPTELGGAMILGRGQAARFLNFERRDNVLSGSITIPAAAPPTRFVVHLLAFGAEAGCFTQFVRSGERYTETSLVPSGSELPAMLLEFDHP
jgi:hypothetical protein